MDTTTQRYPSGDDRIGQVLGGVEGDKKTDNTTDTFSTASSCASTLGWKDITDAC